MGNSACYLFVYTQTAFQGVPKSRFSMLQKLLLDWSGNVARQNLDPIPHQEVHDGLLLADHQTAQPETRQRRWWSGLGPLLADLLSTNGMPSSLPDRVAAVSPGDSLAV